MLTPKFQSRLPRKRCPRHRDTGQDSLCVSLPGWCPCRTNHGPTRARGARGKARRAGRSGAPTHGGPTCCCRPFPIPHWKGYRSRGRSQPRGEVPQDRVQPGRRALPQPLPEPLPEPLHGSQAPSAQSRPGRRRGRRMLRARAPSEPRVSRETRDGAGKGLWEGRAGPAPSEPGSRRQRRPEGCAGWEEP